MPSKPIILLLEDDERFLDALKPRLQKHLGDLCTILFATTVEKADALLEEHGPSIAVLVTDVMMPDGAPAGIELAARYAAAVPIIVISAFPKESFQRAPETLGVVAYLQKSSRAIFFNGLMTAIDEVLASREQPSISLSKDRGTELCTRFRLAEISASQVSKIDLRNIDFQAIAHGTREWQSSIESAGGRVVAIHGQSLHACFLDQARNQDSVRRAIDSFVHTCDSMTLQYQDGFDRCPFGTALLTGLLSSGLFGIKPPGIPAIVGRIGDLAEQLAMTARPRELAVLPKCLSQENARYIKNILGTPARSKLVQLTNVIELVDVSYFRWMPRA